MYSTNIKQIITKKSIFMFMKTIYKIAGGIFASAVLSYIGTSTQYAVADSPPDSS